MSRRSRLVPLLLAALVSACGVPTGGAPATIAPSDVPYGLASPSRPAAPTDSPQAAPDPGRVYLVGAGDTLVPREREISGVTRIQRLADLLGDLAAGPTAEERDEQLSTALPPDVRIAVDEVRGRTATIDIAGPAEAPSGPASGRAVAQVVLTATSVPGIESVLLTVEGNPVDAPLPTGELTSEPVTAADYGSFLLPEQDDTGVPPFLADTGPDTEAASDGARLTLSDVRIGRHDRFDRVVFEVAGTGKPGWDVRYVDAAAAGTGSALPGEALLQVRILGAGAPTNPAEERYAGPARLSVADTQIVTEVAVASVAEDATTALVGTSAREPFRVYLMANPVRVVVEVAG